MPARVVHSHHTLSLVMDSVRGSAIRDTIDLNPARVQPRGAENEASCQSRRAPGATAASAHAEKENRKESGFARGGCVLSSDMCIAPFFHRCYTITQFIYTTRS